MDKFLIAGLGNIGAEYAHTRHNIGFDVLTELAAKHQTSFRIDRLAEVAEFTIKGRKVVLIKPTTYMNLSGKAVKFWLDKEKVDVSRLFVIVDEIALPLNKIRIRGTGSPGGHNGLKDISAALGTDNYAKLRFGVGNDYPKGRQVDFVLSKWNNNEIPLVNNKIQHCTEVIETFILQGLDKSMNLFNNIVFE